MTRAKKRNRLNLYLHWPVGAAGTPSRVSTELVRRIVARRDELPYELSLVAPRRFRDEAMRLTGTSAVLTVSEFPFVARSPGVLHLPVSAVLPGLPTPNTLARLWLHATALMRGLEIVTNYHGLRFDGFSPREWFRRTRNLGDVLLGLPDYLLGGRVVAGNCTIIACSPFMASALHSRFGEAAPIVSLPHGVDEWWFDEDSIDLAPLEGEPAVFYHGDLSTTKGVDLLLAAFAAARQQSPSGMRIHLAGGGPETGAIHELVSRLALDDVVICHGTMDHKHIKAYLKGCAAAIYPSAFDSFSYAVLEALSCAGGQVIVSSHAGISSYPLWEELDLHTVEPTVESLTRVLIRVSRGVLPDRTEQQRQFANSFRWPHIVDDYLVFYQNLAEELF